MIKIDERLKEARQTNPHEHYQRFSVIHSQCHSQIQLSFPGSDKLKFGQLRTKDSKNLSDLLTDSQILVEFEAIVAINTLREIIRKARTNSDAMVTLNINVYGPKNQADEVGEKLSQRKLWLQHTSYKRRNAPYFNPHILSFDGLTLPETEYA